MKIRIVTLVFLFISYSPISFSQEPIIYPAGGQSKQQQDMDEYQCYNWAKNESMFDPMQSHAVSAPPAEQGSAVRGAARGAAIGAIVGNSDDAAKEIGRASCRERV